MVVETVPGGVIIDLGEHIDNRYGLICNYSISSKDTTLK